MNVLSLFKIKDINTYIKILYAYIIHIYIYSIALEYAARSHKHFKSYVSIRISAIKSNYFSDLFQLVYKDNLCL